MREGLFWFMVSEISVCGFGSCGPEVSLNIMGNHVIEREAKTEMLQNTLGKIQPPGHTHPQ